VNVFIVSHLLGLFAVRAFSFSEPTKFRCVDPHHIPRRFLGFSTLVYCPIFPFSHLAIPFTRIFVVVILVSDKALGAGVHRPLGLKENTTGRKG